jgi:multiple sugar transport system substrate-binding protein
MRKSRIVIGSVLLALMLLTFSATSAVAQSSVKLRFLWPGTSDIEKEVAGDLQNAVQAKYPGTSIEFIYLDWASLNQKVAIMVQSRDYPDLLMTLGIKDFVSMDALEPLDAYCDKDLNTSMISKAPLQIMTDNGTIYGVPGIMDMYGTVVNTKLLAKAGMKPGDITTWATLKKAVKAMARDGKYGYAMANGGGGRFLMRDLMMACISNGTRSDDITPQSKSKYVEVLQLFKDMSSSMPKSQSTWKYPELYRAYANGDIGIMHSGVYFTANLPGDGMDALNWTDAIVFPQGPSASKPAAMGGTAGFGILKGSKNKDAAWKVIKVMFTPPILAKWSIALAIPGVNYLDDKSIETGAKAAWPEVWQQHMRLIKQFMVLDQKYGIPEPQLTAREPTEKVVQAAVYKMFDGQLTADQAYGDIKKGIEEVRLSVQ